MKYFLILAFCLVAGFLAYVRLSVNTPERWHVDPESAADPGKAGVMISAGTTIWPMTAARLMQEFNAIALDEPRTRLLAGSVADLHATYVARTRWIGFPDLITVRTIPDGTGSTLAIVSRSRFGRSDFGVNQARLARWLKTLETFKQ